MGNQSASAPSEVPVIGTIENHFADAIMTLNTVSPYSTPVSNIQYGAHLYTGITEFEPTRVDAYSDFNGPYDIAQDMTVTDANGTSLPVSLIKQVKTGWIYKTPTVANASLDDASLFKGLVSNANDQITFQEVVNGETIDTDEDGIFQSFIPLGVYNIPAYVLDSTSSYLASNLQSIDLTVLNNVPTAQPLQSVTDGITGQNYDFIFNVIGQGSGTTCWITNTIGELANDGTSWTQNATDFTVTTQLRLSIVAPANGVTTQLVGQVNGVDYTASLTANAGNIAPSFNVPEYDNVPTYTAGESVTLTPNINNPGSPLGTFTLLSGTLPAGSTLNATTGVIDLVLPATETTGTFTVRFGNIEGNSDAVINWETVLSTITIPAITRLGVPITGETVDYTLITISDNTVFHGSKMQEGDGSLIITDGLTATGIDYQLILYVTGQELSIADPLVTSE